MCVRAHEIVDNAITRIDGDPFCGKRVETEINFYDFFFQINNIEFYNTSKRALGPSESNRIPLDEQTRAEHARRTTKPRRALMRVHVRVILRPLDASECDDIHARVIFTAAKLDGVDDDRVAVHSSTSGRGFPLRAGVTRAVLCVRIPRHGN